MTDKPPPPEKRKHASTLRKITTDEVKGKAPGQKPIAGTRKWARERGFPVDGPPSED
jgi:hypothetical protein